MDSLAKTLHKEGKFNIRYIIGHNLYPWEHRCSICYSDVVYTIFDRRPEDQGTGGKPANLYIIYTLSQFLAIFEVRRYYNAI